MTLAILSLLVALAPVVVALVMRRLRERTPEEKRQEDHEANAKAVASGDVRVVNVRLDDAVRRVQPLSRDRRFKGGDADASGEGVRPGD